MDSLLASYASSDEEDGGSHQPILRSNPPKGKETGGFLSSLPPPKSSSSLLFSLPPPKVQNPISSAPIKPHTVDADESPQLQGNRDDSGLLPSLPRPSSSLLSSLPQPKSSSSSSLFSSLPSPKTHNAEHHTLPQLSSASPAPASRKVVQFRLPTMNHPAHFGNEDEEDEDEEEKEKQRRKSDSLIQTSSVKSFLSSIPKPKNSTTFGVLPSASGSGRRSMLEAEVPGSNDSNAGMGSAADSSRGYYDSNSADNHVPASSTSDASGFSDNVPAGDYAGWGSGSENYVNYDGYTGHGNSGVIGEGYSNLGAGTVDYANYDNEYGNYAAYGQYQSEWTDGSTPSAVPHMSGPTESVLRMSGKRGRSDAPAEIVEVKQDELMKNRPREDQAKLTGIAFGPSYQPTSTKGKPTKLHKRKHQIGSLFYDMKQKEAELAERRAKGFLTKAQTQGKYGW